MATMLERDDENALLRFFPIGWKNRPLRSIDPRDADVRLLCEASLCDTRTLDRGPKFRHEHFLVLTMHGCRTLEARDALVVATPSDPEPSDAT